MFVCAVRAGVCVCVRVSCVVFAVSMCARVHVCVCMRVRA